MAKPELHYHVCKQCKRRYPDACATPKDNKVCSTCRSGRLSIHMQGIAPRPCCYEHLRVARKDELKTYRLAGTDPWWICAACCRQFGYDVRITHA
jgi:hypothetical protein